MRRRFDFDGALKELFQQVENYHEVRHGRHCVFNMHVHSVFVAKYRRLVFDKAARDTLKAIFGSIFSWSRSYFAASCGGPISIIRRYIEQQKTPA